MKFSPYTHQQKTIDFYKHRDRAFDASDMGCVSADTEYLTPSGWKRFDTYDNADTVAQWHPQAKSIEFIKPLKYIKEPCSEMIHINPGKGTSQKLSLDHKVLMYHKQNTTSFSTISALDYINNLTDSERVHKKLSNSFETVFKLHTDNTGLNLTEAELRLQIACVAKGNFSTAKSNVHKWVISIKKERKKERLRNILRSMLLPFKENEKDSGYSVFSFYTKNNNKEFTEYYWGCSQKQLDIIKDEVLYWGKSFSKRNNSLNRFSSTSKKSIDFVQYAFSSGSTAKRTFITTNTRKNNKSNNYSLIITNNKTTVGPGPKKQTKIIPTEDGYKYCFTVPSGFLLLRNNGYIFATGNCGKTFCVIHDVESRLYANPKSKTLILAPKSLLETVWQNDFTKFTPHIITSVAVAPTKKREAAFAAPANVYITNIDALVWLSNKPVSFWDEFETIVVDESTCIKNDSARTKAALKIRHNFKYRRCLSGTPTAGLLTDLFFQYLFLDDGASLGNSFTKFRNQVLIAKQTGPHPKMVTWSNKPGREKILAHLLKPMTMRHVLEDVVDMPPTVKYTYKFKLNPKMRRAYDEMKANAQVSLATGTINAVNAAALTTKLLQSASGTIIETSTGESHLVDTQRYELVLDLVQQTKHSVVFYNWKHQREYMVKQADKRGVSNVFIDGTVPFTTRKKIIDDYQAGKYTTIFLQLKSSSHGLTLTKATHTIWSCPSYLSDSYKQANRRVYRIGQTKRTTIINVEAENTLDGVVYEKLNGKLSAMELLTEAL